MIGVIYMLLFKANISLILFFEIIIILSMSFNKTNKSNSPTKSSPLEAPSYNKLKLDKKAVVKKLLYLFTYYSARSSRYSYNELPEKYFMEMFCDVWADASKPIK